METSPLRPDAAVCGQSPDSADKLRTSVEIGANVVALFKLPMRVKELAGIIEQLDAVHGRELRMIEQPQGWLQFFKP